MMTRTGVCIVGGGPAGLLLGLLLAKRGAQVIVLEGRETFDREFRGEVLQPSTAHLLDELGLLGYILEQPALAAHHGHRPRGRQERRPVPLFERIAPDTLTRSGCPSPSFSTPCAGRPSPFPRSNAGWAPG